MNDAHARNAAAMRDAIMRDAFVTSAYPVILSLENHLSLAQMRWQTCSVLC